MGYLPTPVFLDFSGGSAGKESTSNVGKLSSVPGLGRSPGEGKGYPLQYCALENPMNCIVPGVAKSQIQLSDFHKLFPSFSNALQAQSQPHLRHHGHLHENDFQISISRPHFPSEHLSSFIKV